MIAGVLNEIGDLNDRYQRVTNSILSLGGGDFATLVENISDFDDTVVARVIAFRLADFETDSQLNMYVLEMTRKITTSDLNLITNIKTALQRLDQKGVSWRTNENLSNVNAFIKRCSSLARICEEELEEFRELAELSFDK